MSTAETRQVFQPIHPDILPKLLPEYVEFHNANTAFVPAVHTVPWDPAVRQGPPVIGGSTPLPVGSVKDIPLSHCTMRVFTPEGPAPSEGWPVFLFFHGGQGRTPSEVGGCSRVRMQEDGPSETSTPRMHSRATCANVRDVNRS